MFLLAQRRATEHLYPHNKKCARFNLSKRGWIPGPHFASPHNGHRSEHFPMIHHKIDLWKMFLCVFYRNGISHQNIVKITFSHNKMFSDRTPTHTKYSIFRLEEKEGKCLLRKENKLFFIVFWATFDFLMWLQPHIIPSAYFPVAPHSRAVHRPFFYRKILLIHRNSRMLASFMQRDLPLMAAYWITFESCLHETMSWKRNECLMSFKFRRCGIIL